MTDDETREPVTVWDAFEVEKQGVAYAQLAERLVEAYSNLYALIEMLEDHPTAQAGALLEAWRQRKTQPPDKRAG